MTEDALDAFVRVSLSQWIRRTTMLVDRKQLGAMVTRITVGMLEAALRGFWAAGLPIDDVIESVHEMWEGFKEEIGGQPNRADEWRALEKEALMFALSYDPAKAPPWILEIQKKAQALEVAHVRH